MLLSILRLGDQAYGVSIREESAAFTVRASPGAVYTTLDRLEERGLVTSLFGHPAPERGGRAKRYFQVSKEGAAAGGNGSARQ